MSPSTIVVCPSCGTKNRVPAAATGTPRCGSCQAGVPGVAEPTDAVWVAVLDEAPLPVLVDFWAEWCGPCRMVSPVLEQLATEYAGRVKLVKVDVDAAPVESRRFAVQGIPTLAELHVGEGVARRTGAAGADQLRVWLDGALARA